MIRPRQRIRPSEAAARYLRTEKGEWSPDLVPYCLEPLDLLGSRRYQGIVFVGPARTGKTMGLILGGITYVVTSSPGDMLVVQMSQDAARDFSRMDLDRALRHSPELAARMSPRARDDNTFDKFFRSGVALKLGWPAVSQLSAKTLQYVFLTDYDRPENAHNVDGEGPMWGLAFKRTQTYMSRGKCLAESSPGEDQIDADWLQRSPHEAPPARGILSIYNTGTRARWYWPCLHCGEAFEAKPGLDCFAIPEFDELAERIGQQDLMTLAARWAKVVCPHCGGLHEPEDRSELNARGVWLHEGERLVDGKVEGERRQTQIASYWLGGVAAAYQTWPSILHEYLQAVQTYVRTGDESPLKRTVNTDQGAPYLPIAATRKRSAEDLVKRVEDLPRGAVPDECRFLTAAVDVQLSRFVDRGPVHDLGERKA
jgi:phage terminase large subunit GpA-like protein